MQQTTPIAASSPEQALAHVLFGLVERGEVAVTPAAETQLQNALVRLRSSSPDKKLLRRVEEALTLVAIISNSRRSGRPNLAASTMLRLKRLVQQGGFHAQLH